jgi:hypothetical protein
MPHLVVNKEGETTSVFFENRTPSARPYLPGQRLAVGVSVKIYPPEYRIPQPKFLAWDAVLGRHVTATLGSTGWIGWLALPNGGEIEVTWCCVNWGQIIGIHPILTRASVFGDESNLEWNAMEFMAVCQELGLCPAPRRLEAPAAS